MRLTTKITTSQLEAAFAFVITTIFIFITNDTLFFGTNSAAIFSQIKYLLFYGVLVYLVIKNLQPRVIRAKRDDLYILLIMIFIILLCASFYGDFRGGYIQKIWVIVGSFLLCNLYSIDVITGIYNKAMSFLVWVSLIYELIYMFFPQLLSIYTVTNTGGVEFYSCIFSNMPVESGGVIRNFGFAREPGVYAIYIVLALLFETFSTGNKRTNRIVIYIIGILTTLSTTGYIALASYLVTLFCYLNLFRFKRKKVFGFYCF